MCQVSVIRTKIFLKIIQKSHFRNVEYNRIAIMPVAMSRFKKSETAAPEKDIKTGGIRITTSRN